MRMYRASAISRDLLFSLLAILALVGSAFAAPVTVTREYTYRAGEADSKLTSRTIALEQVKRILLEELGTYLMSSTEVKNASLTKDEIVTYTAGTLITIIMEERWNGEEYYLKAKITCDPDDVSKSVTAMREDQDRSSELEQLRKESNQSLKEIARLKNELDKAKSSPAANSAATAETKQKYVTEVSKLAAKDHLEQGLLLERSGELGKALEEFDKAIAQAPQWPRPYIARGMVLNRLDRSRQAMADLDYALNLNPNDRVAGAHKAVTLLKLGRRAEGMALFERVTVDGRGTFPADTKIGALLLQNNLPKDALFFLNRSVKRQPDKNPRAYFLRSQAHKSLGMKQKARQDMITASKQGDREARVMLKKDGGRPLRPE